MTTYFVAEVERGEDMKCVMLLLCLMLTGCAVVEDVSISNMEPAVEQSSSLEFEVLGESTLFPLLSTENVIQMVTADINAQFLNNHDPDYLALLGRTEAESVAYFQKNVGLEAQVLLDVIWAEYPDETTWAEATAVVELLYQRLAFRVHSAHEDEETGHFQVKIAIAPVSGVDFATESYLLAHFEEVTQETDVLSIHQEDYEYYDNIASLSILNYLRQGVSELSYGKEQELVLELVKEEFGYRVDIQDWYQLRELALDYKGHYK